MENNKKLVRFDWAMKKLLRDKTNFDILEGFLSELLKESIKIEKILDSESNKETENDKFNRVDVLVENAKGELIIVEVQNSKEYDYFHRILFGTSKVITEYIQKGDDYEKIKKVISITIAYFDLGQGKDYVYHSANIFKGMHHDDILNLSKYQKETYAKKQVYEIFPEYWIIKVDKFRNLIQDKLDEWIYFLRNSEIKPHFTAQGLNGAKNKLNEMKLSEPQRKEYDKYLTRLMDISSFHRNREIEEEYLKKMQTKVKEAQEDAQKAKEDTQKAKEDTQKAKEDAQKAKEDAQKAKEDAQKAKEDAQKAKEDAQKAKEDAQKAQEDTQKAQEDTQKAKEDTQKAQEDAQKAKEDTQKAQEETEEIENKIKDGVLQLYKSKVSISTIAKSFNMSEEKIKKIVS